MDTREDRQCASLERHARDERVEVVFELGPVEQDDGLAHVRQQRASKARVPAGELAMELGVAQQAIDALDAVLRPRSTADLPTERGDRQPLRDEHGADGREDGLEALGVDPGTTERAETTYDS